MKTNRVIRATIGKEGQEGSEFSDLKMEFRVSKTETSDPNECNLSIINLNSDSRNKITDKDQVLLLYAGYEDDTGEELIFKGDITNADNNIQRPEVITSIAASDGERKLNNTKISYSFKEGTSVFQVVDKVFKKFNLPVKTRNLLEPLKKLKFNNGNTFMGKAKKALDVLFAGVGMDWSVQNGELKAYLSDESDQTFAIELIASSETEPGTGLIGSPKRIKMQKNKKDKTSEVDGWSFVSLIEPKAEPGGIVIVKSKEIPERSEFKIINVEHNGNNVQGQFTTTIEAIQL